MATFKQLGFTDKQIQAARRYAARPAMKCAMDTEANKIDYVSHVTEAKKADIAISLRDNAREIVLGLHDGNFTIWQRMNTYLTGECIAFLPK